MAKLVYICDWLPPDFGAVGQYSLLFARNYAREDGHDVVLVGLSSEARSRTMEKLGRGTLTIQRIRANSIEKARWRRRLAWTLKTNLRLLASVFRDLRTCDEIIFTGSPPFMLHLIMPLNLLLKKRVVYRITDFHPECLMASIDRKRATVRALYRWTCFWRRRVDQFQVLGADQKRRLREIGIARDRIVMKRDPSPVAITGREAPLTPPTAIRGYAILLYSGNFGIAHEVRTFVDGYIEHHRSGRGRVALWLNATGTGTDEVEHLLLDAGVPFARTMPVGLDQLGQLLVTPDAHLITLKDAFVGYVMPSKVYGCIASGRSILFVGSRASDVHLLCSESGSFYQRVDVGDPWGVAAGLEAIGDQGRDELNRRCVERALVEHDPVRP